MPVPTNLTPSIDHIVHMYFIDVNTSWPCPKSSNAITTINPNTLVQPGTVTATPEFSTGTMAIVSVDKRDRPFNMNGPYIDLKIAMD